MLREWFRRLRSLIEDQEFPIKYPCHMGPGDSIKLADGRMKTFARATVIRNESELEQTFHSFENGDRLTWRRSGSAA